MIAATLMQHFTLRYYRGNALIAFCCLDLENAARLDMKLLNFPKVTSSHDDETINNYEIKLLKEWFSKFFIDIAIQSHVVSRSRLY